MRDFVWVFFVDAIQGQLRKAARLFQGDFCRAGRHRHTRE
jgi:hypothetical protein